MRHGLRSRYEIPHLANQGFRLHKDHVQKDLLDCDAPLVHYPPTDALRCAPTVERTPPKADR